MATIRVFNDIFEAKSEDFIYDTSRPLLEQIEDHIDKEVYKSTMVECYDPQTGETFYAPMEDDNETEGILIVVNGKSVDGDYIPKENDLVNVVFTPMSKAVDWVTNTNAGRGLFIGLGSGSLLVAMVGAFFGPAGIAIGALLGLVVGGFVGWAIGYNIDEKQSAGGKINNKNNYADKEGQHPDVRGCANQTIVGNNFPCVIGKHLTTPFIVGDPYTEYSGTKGKDAYIRELLCVGYAPLKLTDFKLGDFWLAYNRSHGNISKDTMLAGLLKGYSSGGVADNGDIVDYWEKNDVSIEILQQPASGQGIGYGSIYPYVAKEQEVNANIMYVASGTLDKTVQVTYKGTSFPNTFRTNTVIFTEACPREFTVNLDFPNGLYGTYTHSVKSGDTVTTDNMFVKIPLWMCIQWRVYNENNPPSQNDGSDYASWNNIDFGYTANFSTQGGVGLPPVMLDKLYHAGNEFSQVTYDDIYGSYLNKNLQNFESLGGGDVNKQPGEIRVSATVTLTKEQCKQIIADTNPGRLIEIRVLRVSPNYIDEMTDTSYNDDANSGPMSFSDHVIARTVVTKIFDEQELRDNDELVAVRPVSEEDLKKYCFVAIKCKADAAGYIQRSLDSINCVSESFSPIWDKTEKKILPEGVHKVRKYYGYFLPGTNTPTNRTNTADEREVTKTEYEQARHNGYNWYMEKVGSNFTDIMKGIVMSQTAIHNETTCWFLPNAARKYNDNLASSGFLLGAFGAQNGPEGIGEEDINIISLGDWAEKIEALKDGSTFQRDTVYNGVQYHKDDEIPVRMEANAYIYSGIKIEDLLQKISACGRAVWVVDETGKVKVIMDGPVDYTKGVISDENCLSSSNSFSYEEAPAGLFCTFNDENDGFENNSFYVWSDGNSMERHHGSVDSFHIDFVTNPYQMHSLGRYFLACLIQSKESLTRKIGPGGIIYSIGDVLLVQSRELLIGETSGRIQDVIVYDGFIYGFVTDVTYEYTAELDTDGNSVQGVTIVQPRYAGKSNAVTLPLSEPRTIDITSGYIEVTPKGNENPQQEGWYEKDGNNYVLTTDTTVVAGHTYYEAIVNSYTLEKGTTNVVLFGKISDIYHDERDYAVPVDTTEDPSPSSVTKCNFKTGDIVLFGLVDKTAAPYRITKIKPEAGGKFTETLLPYDESLYNYGAALPTFQTYITPPPVAIDPVELSDVPTTLGAQQNVIKSIYKLVGFVKNTTPPAAPTNVIALAYKDYIQLTWSVEDVENTKETVIELSRQSGAENTWIPVAAISSNKYRYYFNRDDGADGYPEGLSPASPAPGVNYLSNYRFRLKNVSMFDYDSEWEDDVEVDYSVYGTWEIPEVLLQTEILDRTAVITATHVQGDKELYGTPNLKIWIKRVGNTEIVDGVSFNERYNVTPDANWLVPEFSKDVGVSETQDTERNYYNPSADPVLAPYISSSYKITHTLPLIGQNVRLYNNGVFINKFAYEAPNVSIISDVDTIPQTPEENQWIHYIGATTAEYEQGKYYVYKAFYNRVTPVGSENPHQEGWYVKLGNIYILTQDTTVNAAQTYYAKTCQWVEIVAGDLLHYTGNTNTAFTKGMYYIYEDTPSDKWTELVAKNASVPTQYFYKIQMFNEANRIKDYNTKEVSVIVLPTNISDIVHSHEHYKDLYVEKLSAINANIGLISQGGFGSFEEMLNYWALSTLTAQETGVAGGIKKGAFRVGGETEYFKVTPPHFQDNNTDEYRIELKAGNIELTSAVGQESALDFTKGTFIYDITKTRRMNLTPDGIVIEKEFWDVEPDGTENPKQLGWYEYTNGSYVLTQDETVQSGKQYYISEWNTVGQVTINSNNDMIIANTEAVPELGHHLNGDIYHFDGTLTDESGQNPQAILTEGDYAINSNVTEISKWIITQGGQSLRGTVTKDIHNYEGRIGFVSGSQDIQFGFKALKLDGTFKDIPAPLTGYNEAMKDLSTVSGFSGTVGAYLGLSESQVNKGIFF